MKSIASFVLTSVFAAGSLVATSAPVDRSQEVQTPTDIPLPHLPALDWKLPPKYASIEGDKLVVDIPESDWPASAVAEAEIPAELIGALGGFSMTGIGRGTGIRKPTKWYLGLKFQIHWQDSVSGQEGFPNCEGRIGDFDLETLRSDGNFFDAKPDKITLMLGLQETSGRVEFDLSSLCAGASPGLFRRVNEDFRVSYPDEVANAPRRRGVMLPNRDITAEDFDTLQEWGVSLVRFQMMRNWSKIGDNQDLAEYAEWVDGRLDNLERVVLPEARRRGIKVVVDLHVTPGGRDEKREMTMFRNAEWAREFVETWRRIATRFRGNADVIYGYDLVNEPNQIGRAPFDYWTLQRLAAEAVREIDPETTIIIESNGWDAANTFWYLSPLAMDNVIYQVHCYHPMAFSHQGIGSNGPKGPVWPDPEKGWDRDFIRKELKPVRDFQERTGAKIYVGEFSAVVWASGGEKFLEDSIAVFEEYGWDWSYHAFREWSGWSLEHEGPDGKHLVPSADNPRKRVMLEAFKR